MAGQGFNYILVLVTVCLLVHLTRQEGIKEGAEETTSDRNVVGNISAGQPEMPNASFDQHGMTKLEKTIVGNVLALSDMEQKLVKDLFTGYSKQARPVLNKSHSVEVILDMAYSQLKELDSRNQVLQSKVWLRQYWTNPFLAWDPKKYGGIKTINVSPNLIWKPDIVLYNSVGYGETGSIYNFDTKAVIDFKGYTNWFAPTEIHSICKIDITYFPFDEQKCVLKFGSWTYTATALNVVNMRTTADISKYIENGEWELKEASLVRNVLRYTCCPDPYVDITYTIHVKRKVKFYVTNLIMPCVLLAALTILSHCLPPASGERMGLDITILLGLTIFMLMLTENIPQTSDVIPLLGKYAFTILCEVTLSLLFTCYVLCIFYKNPSKRLDGWFRVLIYKILAPLLFKSIPGEDHNNDSNENQVKRLNKTRGSSCCRRFSYPEEGELAHMCLPNSLDTCPPDSHLLHKNKTDSLDDMSHVSNMAASGNLVVGMKKIVRRLDEIQEAEERQREWHFAAEVMDLFFLWLLALTFVISSIVFYMIAP